MTARRPKTEAREAWYGFVRVPRRIVRDFRAGRIDVWTYIVLVDLYESADWRAHRVRVTLPRLRKRARYPHEEASLGQLLRRLRKRGELTFRSTPGRHGHVYEITLLPDGPTEPCSRSEGAESRARCGIAGRESEAVSEETPVSEECPRSPGAPCPRSETPVTRMGSPIPAAPSAVVSEERAGVVTVGVTEQDAPVSEEPRAASPRRARENGTRAEGARPRSPDYVQTKAKPSGKGGEGREGVPNRDERHELSADEFIALLDRQTAAARTANAPVFRSPVSAKVGERGFLDLVHARYRSGALARDEWLGRVALHGRVLRAAPVAEDAVVAEFEAVVRVGVLDRAEEIA